MSTSPAHPTEPLRCQICQRTATLNWHSLDDDLLDRADCRAADGAGTWVCGICEEALHRWMSEHPGPGSSRKAETEMLNRLAALINTKSRPYRQRKRDRAPEEDTYERLD